MTGESARRPRTFRDPVHGDIVATPLAVEIVNTIEFQRLRYVRQNGLLHFVFPGAVHTRFAHSIGTMHLARKAFETLTRPIKAADQSCIRYLGTVFELAGLLHDIGHCAFSHSIENVKLENTPGGKPFLGSVTETFEKWDERQLLAELRDAHGDYGQAAASHEQLGLALIRRIFLNAGVGEACRTELSELSVDPEHVGRDVRAILDDGLRYSDTYSRCAEVLAKAVSAAVREGRIYGDGDIPDNKFKGSFIQVLHRLISGTLDVDRLDYLNRDSHHCGVSYGHCDTTMLLSNLELAGIQGKVDLALGLKAANTLDDMLWSRYQLWVQVLNHKTNVALNELLKQAIPAAIESADGFKAPTDYQEFLCLTDDKVMSAVFSTCVVRPDKQQTAYGKALVLRRLPEHLGWRKLAANATEGEVQDLRRTLEREYGSGLMFAEAKSNLVKEGALPPLVERQRSNGSRKIVPFKDRSTLMGDGKIEGAFRLLHFYKER